MKQLLLLIYITADQSGQATELLSLRYINTVYSCYWNIFIKNSLVNTVTVYYKNYSVNNLIKIIYCYLLRPVSKLVIYYLWLVILFIQNLKQQLYSRQKKLLSFLWLGGKGSWNLNRLWTVLQREIQSQLQTKINILLYCYTVIAISRIYLKYSSFKRNYGTDQSVFNKQASHRSWTADTIYTRGLQEASGYIETRQ